MTQVPSSKVTGPVLITGAAGGLGTYFCSAWGREGLAGRRVVPVVRNNRSGSVLYGKDASYLAPAENVELADKHQTADLIAQLSPSVVVHCAAMTNVDRCEEDRNAAFADNVQATRCLVDAIGEHAPDCHFVYISTDQVYRDGGAVKGEIGPINLYGWTKLWSEDIARQHSCSTVLRLNYVGQGTNARTGLVRWLVDSLRAQKPVTLFDDVLFNPCHGALVPKVAERLIANGITGTFNLGSRGDGMSKADFLLTLADRLELSTQTAKRGRLRDLSLAAPRPFDMRMDVSNTETALGAPLPTLSDTLNALVDEWQAEEQHHV
ncbi:sugar nucleotide-binding protein [Thalassospira sp. MA62]|nr:sugar nucleotide-binding protein [Thalassospira sp. MA62]